MTSNSYLQSSIFAEFRNEAKRVRHTKFRTAHRGTEFLIMVISDNLVNQFHVTGLFLYPMFFDVQGVLKKTCGVKLVNKGLSATPGRIKWF